MGFEYVEPRSVEEAAAILRRAGPDACLIAGGTELMLRVRLGQVRPKLVVGIGRLPELTGIARTDEGGLSLGAAVTLRAIAGSPDVRMLAPLLAEVCAQTRSPQFRTLATVGGTLCGASPLAEVPLALVALDADVEIAGAAGGHRLAVSDFVTGPGRTALQVGEIVTGVFVGPRATGTHTAYERLSRRGAIEPPLVASAVALTLDAERVCRSCRVVLGVATPTPVRLSQSEEMLLGRKLSIERTRAAAQVARAVDVHDDVRATRPYLQRMAGIVVGRALARATKAASSRG